MKKIISLMLALLVCLSVLPAMAEEPAAPAVNNPITLEAYQAAYGTVVSEAVPGCSVTWQTAPIEGGEAWMALLNGSFVSVLVLPEDGNVAEIAVLLQADLSENSLMTFLSMACYAGAALMQDEEVTTQEACDASMAELFNVFSAINEGTMPETLFGLPGNIQITPMEDESCQYYLIIKLAE